jgi:hypothetical protein
MMHKVACGLCALASMAWAFPIHAQATGPAQATAPALELAFMPQTEGVKQAAAKAALGTHR